MVDVNALERQLADESLRIIGPARPVDDLAVFDAVIAANRSHTRGFEMFSALKFVAAGVIVALFGSFLLAGILTTQQDGEVPPAAVTESPAPLTTEELLSGMVTEEVEPGVFRVVNDGVRDMVSRNNRTIVAGHDDGIWLLRENRFLRLGRARGHAWPADVWGSWAGLEVTPDGSVWTGVDRHLRSFDGESWTIDEPRSDFELPPALAVAPDGALWASWWGPDDGETTVARRGADGWELLEASAPTGHGLVANVLENGDVWVMDAGPGMLNGVRLYRHADGDWEEIAPDPEGLNLGSVLGFWGGEGVQVGDDGTVWLTGMDRDGAWPRDGFVVRFDGAEWRAWGPADGVPPVLGSARVQQASDGALWLATVDPSASPVKHDGVARFDGSGWQQFLPGHAVFSLDIATDGSVWLVASDETRDSTTLYVITPEAVAATE